MVLLNTILFFFPHVPILVASPRLTLLDAALLVPVALTLLLVTLSAIGEGRRLAAEDPLRG
jgi:hypothetical protein